MTPDASTLKGATPRRSPLKLFLLVLVFSLPFWLAGTLTAAQLLPALPISALMFVCPATATAILVYREHAPGGMKEWLKRAFDYRRAKSKIWFVPTILLMPAIMVLSYIVIRLMGVSVPAPAFSIGAVLALFVAFFIGALGEELGWSAYAIDPLQRRFGAFGGALVLGAVWAVWHYIPLFQVDHSLVFVLWWTLGTVADRVIIVWLYNNTGRSVFVAALFHAMINLTWQLFPINGSFYDPRVTGLITAVVAVIAVVVWGPHTLTRSPTKLQ